MTTTYERMYYLHGLPKPLQYEPGREYFAIMYKTKIYVLKLQCTLHMYVLHKITDCMYYTKLYIDHALLNYWQTTCTQITHTSYISHALYNNLSHLYYTAL